MPLLSTARIPTTLGRRLLPRLSHQSFKFQRRWAEVHDVRFLATTQAPRNVAEKYKEKLDRKAREEGHSDLSGLKDAYAGRIRELKQRDSISVPGLDAILADEEPESQAQTPAGSKRSSENRPKASGSTIKPLSEILDLDKARVLPVKELSAIWRLRHASNSNSLCAVVPSRTHMAMQRTARLNPTFVLPVPRKEQGAEIHFLQWVFDAMSGTSTVLFTQLAEYKLRGEFAQPHTSITHYTDYGAEDGLSLDKNQGVALMAGTLEENRGASLQDAQFLVMLLQKFYGEEGLAARAEKRKLLEEFNTGDSNFSIEKLLEECEKLD
ncbi:ATP11-domain-containing protein [Xylariaceae sp. FL1019]|nr:ATP11-domain-containing protein [Xylariaceae sp. FL1019]